MLINSRDLQDASQNVIAMQNREATLVAEITAMRAQIKVARQDAWSGRNDLDPQWLRKVNYAIIMRKRELAGLRVTRCAEQNRIKEERRRRELDSYVSEQALFMRHARRLLPRKLYDEIRAAARNERLLRLEQEACEQALKT
ncbi:hypothetical protein DM813_22570 [Pseudomonas alkylphenolica]|uniref:Uncharacterized protein n=1 Tax=Pseudomonas alkylphenolica TaxID=237609 RepID=A0A443ZJK0_9PSED|nr:hypothetical protein [Pseudomonas alkylphenolica]RWU19105.1 hypothetical protein DM813_22570 [Pseudomonas alkylphenolica]